MTFQDLFGHEDIKRRLQTAVQQARVSHAYVFSGKRGIGKTTAALAFASLLTGGSAADVTVVTNEQYDRDSKSGALSVRAVRAVGAELYVKPYAAEKRVFIIPNAERMTVQAQNALLKAFEEPPAYCVIILVTQNEQMLLPTIRSRAVSVRFSPLDDAELRAFLGDRAKDCSPLFLRLADGSPGRAMELLENGELESVLAEFVPLFASLAAGGAAAVYKLIGYFAAQKDNYGLLFDVMQLMLRETAAGQGGTAAVPGVAPCRAMRGVELIEKTRSAFSYNANYDMAVSEMLLNLLEELHD